MVILDIYALAKRIYNNNESRKENAEQCRILFRNQMRTLNIGHQLQILSAGGLYNGEDNNWLSEIGELEMLEDLEIEGFCMNKNDIKLITKSIRKLKSLKLTRVHMRLLDLEQLGELANLELLTIDVSCSYQMIRSKKILERTVESLERLLKVMKSKSTFIGVYMLLIKQDSQIGKYMLQRQAAKR